MNGQHTWGSELIAMFFWSSAGLIILLGIAALFGARGWPLLFCSLVGAFIGALVGSWCVVGGR